MLILGIETSCDETAAAVVRDGREILSSAVASQIEIHRRYGGVFPEIASRQHILAIVPVLEEAMQTARVQWDDLDAVAVTHGPGLPGSLLVGVNAAKGLAYARGLPLIGVNHLEAHIHANWLKRDGERVPAYSFPLLCLIVSGGHTALVLMRGHGRYELLGQTLDDAAGEAFDKVGRLLGLDYPGGPAIQAAAHEGNPTAFDLPRAKLRDTYDFSFSGLKTAVLLLVQKYEGGNPNKASKERMRGKIRRMPRMVRPLPVADIAASFQLAVVDALVEKTRQAAQDFDVKHVLLSGGVAANRLLREQMKTRLDLPVYFPSLPLCVDNAAMVAGCAFYQWERGKCADWDLDVLPNLRLGDE